MIKEIGNCNHNIQFWNTCGGEEFCEGYMYYYDSINSLWEIKEEYCAPHTFSNLILSIETNHINFYENNKNIRFETLNNLLSNKNFGICLIYDKKYILLSENYRFEEIKILKKETGIQDAIDKNCDFTKNFGIRDLKTMKWVFYDNDWVKNDIVKPSTDDLKCIMNKVIENNEKQQIRCYKGEKSFSEKCDSCCSAGDEDICSFDPLWDTSLELENENCEDKEQDNVNHPSHYTQGKIECIDYIMDKISIEGFEGYCQGNILKYVTRYQHKNGVEDLKKAVWYINKLIATLENRNSEE